MRDRRPRDEEKREKRPERTDEKPERRERRTYERSEKPRRTEESREARPKYQKPKDGALPIIKRTDRKPRQNGEINITISDKKEQREPRESRPRFIIVDLTGKPEGTGDKLISALEKRLDFCQMKMGEKGDLMIRCPTEKMDEAKGVLNVAKINGEPIKFK